MNNEWGQSCKCLRVVSKHSLSLYLGLVENNSVFVWGQLIVDLIPRYGDLKVNTGNETSGQKATLLLSPRDCVTASLAPTFMSLQMILEDQFLFKTYIHTYAGTLYHVLCSEKVLKVIKARAGHVTFVNTEHSPQPKHVNKPSEVNSVNSCMVNTEPFHSPQQRGAQQLPQSKYQKNLHNHWCYHRCKNSSTHDKHVMFPIFSIPSIHDKEEKVSQQIRE